MKIERKLWLLPMLLILFFAGNANAAMMVDAGDTVIIDDLVEDDVYLAGNTLIVNGTVLGDVVATGGTVEIHGNVSGDLIIAAGDVIITGDIGDDVRVACGNFELSGQIGDDLLVTAGSVSTTDIANVGGDTTIRSGDADIGGNFGGLLDVSAGDLTLAGNVDGNAVLDASDLTIQPNSSIKGNLEYSTQKEISIPAGVVGEEIKPEKPAPREDRFNGEGVLNVITFIGKIAYYMFLFVLGVISILVFPSKTEEIVRDIQEQPFKNVAVGLLILVGTIIGSLVLMITIIGIPIALFLLLLLFIVVMIAKIYTAMWLGEVTFRKVGFEYNQWRVLALGLFLILVLTELPYVGGLIGLLVTLVAMGSMYFALKY
ncbi:hypothetical protein [Methanococcoides methylutens]|uniref:DUF8173 domain-containing protein n=1 Tax=Methanococcoides methylutens MM1 TaxID=1434104 RepID=A0A0E3WZM2_METMT|nr:hypothetical protein [Methanococcoides methylutens]AKB84980.1 hypothetical protein MCMEM_0927 [Methanococcoides methylutens MM1]